LKSFWKETKDVDTTIATGVDARDAIKIGNTKAKRNIVLW